MNNLNGLRKANAAIDIFRYIYPDIPATTIAMFFEIAMNDQVSSSELIDKLGISQSATSRNLSILGDVAWNGCAGLGLIDLVENPNDRRQKLSFLTPKGATLAAKINRMMGGEDCSVVKFETADNFIKEWRKTVRPRARYT